MALQYSVALRNAQLEQIETAIGASGVLEIRSSTVPANCAAADNGTVLASIPLPTAVADVMAAAASGIITKGTLAWEDTSANASGNAGHFRIKTSGGTCVMQGTVSASGGGGDMILDTIAITAGQTVSVTTFSITAGNP